MSEQLSISEPEFLRILSWNVFNENPESARIGAAMSALAPDIVLLQEVLPDHLAEIERHFAHLAVARDYSLNGALCHLVIAGQTPLENVTITTHSAPNKPAPTPWAKLAGWREFLDSLSVDILWHDRPVRLVNIHTSAGVAPSVRFAELAATESHFGHQGPCVVAGDFNSYATPWLAPVLALPLRYTRADWRTHERRRLNHWFESRSFAPTVRGVTFPKGRLQMDQVFVRDLSVRAARIEQRRWGSDHLPLVIDLAR